MCELKQNTGNLIALLSAAGIKPLVSRILYKCFSALKSKKRFLNVCSELKRILLSNWDKICYNVDPIYDYFLFSRVHLSYFKFEVSFFKCRIDIKYFPAFQLVVIFFGLKFELWPGYRTIPTSTIAWSSMFTVFMSSSTLIYLYTSR